MTGKELVEYVRQGNKPIIRFTQNIEDHETQFERDMMAQINNAYFEYECVALTVNESKYSAYNKELERPVWMDDKHKVDCLTFSEVDVRLDSSEIYIGEDEEITEFEFVTPHTLYNHYLESKSDLSYIRWLEESILSMVGEV